jgi:cell division septal protein FtsQ
MTFLESNPYFRFRSYELENYIKENNPLVKDVSIKKSIVLKRSIIDIEEYVPTAIIKNEGEDFFITQSGKTIPYQYTGNSFPTIYLENHKDIKSKEILAEYVQKSIKISMWAKDNINNKIDMIKLNNIGSLSLIFKNNKTFNFDLNELHFSIDDQIKVIQNVLTKVDYKELDLRYSYLVVKK